MPKDSRKGKDKGAKEDDKRSLYLAKVYVALKPTVNDPEGNTIAGALGSLGFDGVEGVRSGRYFQVRLRADGAKAAKKQVDQMCSRLLANPVIEAYSFELDETK
jgi:phosphoribosylformylglycinamidine synthase subunit PurS